jgi:predicted nucleotidyltransferase
MTAPATLEPRLADDPVLIRFRAALDALYGARLERVVLFGSRARGDHRADSDYDIAVFLHDFVDRWREIDRIIPIVTDILYEHEEFIHAMPYRAEAYQKDSALMYEIRADGVDL